MIILIGKTLILRASQFRSGGEWHDWEIGVKVRCRSSSGGSSCPGEKRNGKEVLKPQKSKHVRISVGSFPLSATLECALLTHTPPSCSNPQHVIGIVH